MPDITAGDDYYDVRDEEWISVGVINRDEDIAFVTYEDGLEMGLSLSDIETKVERGFLVENEPQDLTDWS